jgi:exodeoxyribonuclease VII large subunit
LEIYTVSEINRYIRVILEADPSLGDLWLRGEVSNYTQATSGHVYFTLKDPEAQIGCVMWRSHAVRQTYLPKSGEAIVAHGYVSIYEVQGRYQFYVDTIQPAGIGLLHMEFERLKKALAEEGLFDPERKRSLPPYPTRIGVVTSRVGAALRDILNVLSRRYPLVEVILSPTMVQGDQAPPQIVEAINLLNLYADVDLIVVARGGGSLEDLWAFNDERVARAIAASRVPVISGVGHETDYTITDFVADVRAPTPSAAAEMSVPDADELRDTLRAHRNQMAQFGRSAVAEPRIMLEREADMLRRYSPQAQITSYRQRADELLRAAMLHVDHTLALHRERLNGFHLRLSSVSPLATLRRGYAVVRRTDTGDIVRSVRQVRTGDHIGVRVQDGEFGSTVEKDPKKPSYV